MPQAVGWTTRSSVRPPNIQPAFLHKFVGEQRTVCRIEEQPVARGDPFIEVCAVSGFYPLPVKPVGLPSMLGEGNAIGLHPSGYLVEKLQCIIITQQSLHPAMSDPAHRCAGDGVLDLPGAAIDEGATITGRSGG